jgi:HEAT repeat protein
MKIRRYISEGLILSAWLATLIACASTRRPESELLRDLDSTSPSVVCDALQALEKEYPNSATARPAIVAKLDDPRERVRRKAARVLGATATRLDDVETAKVVVLLSSRNVDAVLDGLKALRGTANASSVPAIVPLLLHPDRYVKRDACRTLAVIGDKSLVPAIEPLLGNPDHEVAEDARVAITRLQGK